MILAKLKLPMEPFYFHFYYSFFLNDIFVHIPAFVDYAKVRVFL